MLIALATFATITLFGISTYWVFVMRPEGAEDRALRKRLHAGGGPVPRMRVFRQVQPLSQLKGLDRVLSSAGAIVGPARMLVDRSGMRVTVGSVLLTSVFLGLLTFLAVDVVTGLVLAAVLVALVFAAAPWMYVARRVQKRTDQFEQHFPEAIDLIARALRAGHAFTTGLSMVADELPDPVGTEFRMLHDRQNYGMPLPEAMKEFAERVRLLDARFFVTAVLTQRETGGNLSEVLDNLAALMRERFRVRRQVRVLSAHGRITGWVLACLAPTIAAILFFIAPEHMLTLVRDPIGVRMVIMAIVLQIVGTLIIRRIVNVEI